MALFRTGGGGMSETVLWTNPNPTSSFAGATIVTIDSGKNFSDYDYIKVIARVSTSSSNESESILSYAVFLQTKSGKSNAPMGFVGIYVGSNLNYRSFGRESDTSIYFGNAFQQNATGAKNGNIIPVRIIGIKK